MSTPMSMPSAGAAVTGCDAEQVEYACTFLTHVGGCARTTGLAAYRPTRGAHDLEGLDFDFLGEAAAAQADAAAHGKVAHAGRDGVLVLQTMPRAALEVVWCGNATAAVALMSRRKSGCIGLCGPAGKSAFVSFSTMGATVEQFWTLPSPVYIEERWCGRIVLRCDALNPYAVIFGSLPQGMTPEEARRQLVGPELGTKLAIVTTRPTGQAQVSFHNAGGAHGAAPMTGVATLAILARLSPLMARFIPDGTVTYETKGGPVTTLLPDMRIEANGSVTITMPTVGVRLSPVLLGGVK